MSRDESVRFERRACTMVVAVLSLLTASTAGAATWHVLPDGTGDAPTIQAAVDSSAAGDSILVAAGRYFENVVLQHGLFLIGSWDEAFMSSELEMHATTIDADSSGTCIRAHLPECDRDGLIAGFHLTRGTGEPMPGFPERKRGGALFLFGMGNVRDCVIDSSVAMYGGGAFVSCEDVHLTRVICRDNNLHDPLWVASDARPRAELPIQGGGAYLDAAIHVVVDSCEFSRNRSEIVSGGNGIGLFATATLVTLSHSRFSGNASPYGSSADGFGGGARVVCDSQLDVSECRFEGNDLHGDTAGGGISTTAETADFRDCDFSENWASYGAGIHGDYWGTTTVTNCRFEGNAANGLDGFGAGGGIAGGTLVIEDCWIVDNFGSGLGGGGGGGVYGETVTIRNSVVSNNLASRGGGGISARALYAANVTVTGNGMIAAFGHRGIGIQVRDGGTGTVLNSIIAGNVPTWDPRPDDAGGIWGLVDSRYNSFHDNGDVDHFGLTSEIGSVYADPLLARDGTRRPALHSPAIDRGDPAILDPDGSRSDIGAYGGPGADMAQPDRVTGLTATRTPAGIELEWDASGAPDLDGYAIYRLPSPDAHPSLENFLARTTDTTYLDPIGPPWPQWSYRVSAYDLDTYGGGYSETVAPSRVGSLSVSSTPAPDVRIVSANPATGPVSMLVTTPGPARALIDVFDLRGRRVWSGDHPAPAGTSRLVWPGRDSGGRLVAPGHYFLRVRMGGERFQRKVVIVR